jgi:OOP family OmpA-OmpF porin
MRRLLCAAFALAMVLSTSGCVTYSLAELRKADLQGTPFHKALAARYLEFSSDLERRYDWYNSMHFADKGLFAAYAQEIGPEPLEAWKIDADNAVVLAKARESLLAALNPAAMEREPEAAADAQYYFDCWVHGVDTGVESHSAQCREGFESAMTSLSESKAPAASKNIATSSYMVYFDWGQTYLTKAGAVIVDRVIEELATQDSYEVLLNGHTDTTGSDMQNLKLSQARAEAVKKRLVAGGIKSQLIKVFAFGESDPAVKTADNVKEAKNRRVEIFLND